MKKKLPVGIQSFENIRTENYYYVDKTRFVKKLVDEGKYYFLSRPRRFGKSLFLDTLRQAFLAKKELFEGLYLEDNWDWSIKYPVIYISFGSGVIREKEILQKKINYILDDHAQFYDVCLTKNIIPDKANELFQKLADKCGQKVVVLIDEYDKPILDNINKTETATEIREELKNFYSVLKDADPYLKFVFITGVTKFSKVSLFSGLNNLEDITISPSFATICGYTQSEFEKTFADRLEGVDLDEVRRWYNGYSWLGEPVYNPFDILLFLKEKIFRPYWFETGTPTFLIKLLFEKRYCLPDLENLEAGEELIESFEVENIKLETLLFQTGYLTIAEKIELLPGEAVYKLKYPNIEVKKALADHVLNYIFEDISTKTHNKTKLARILISGDVPLLLEVFKAIFAGIPHDWYRKTELHRYEGFYASVFYAYFAALGLDVRVEDSTSKGRLDMAVRFEDRCYLFEFKVVEIEPEGRALEQLKAKKYHEKYLTGCGKIYLIGIEFSQKERNIVGFEWEEIL
ncbi:AAA-ATPase [Thermodesulfatator indicus DSM 15286]|uniref:AAA-ATPase n=1 Tax=Thermodesulfatator indicus (strain DSM 15286 / JCM 11887 / CIR29812) TaxID=667014 RepID=F8AC44_THEID|nr:ATP-binding protein [Thermodesulfatator indicus]AEH44599.1 AAA-ATPase [Thermodesulfatator indicus DSM 15286]